jgi:hypothetical protein
MSGEVEKLGQILDSTFGLAFLSHILGLDAWEILSGQTAASEISTRATKFRASDLRRPVFELYSDFIREYPFGYTHNWLRLAEELSAASSELTHVLSELTPELLKHGFAADFDHSRQFTVADGLSEPQVFQTNWRSNADAWWTSPNTVPSFHGCSADLSDFAIDDAVVSPRAMKTFAVDESQSVFSIGSVEDWRWLVQKHPVKAKVLHLENWQLDIDLPVTSVWIPDWNEVAEEYAGVYLSPAAYLGASYSLIYLPDGRDTFLSGWSPGATYWLPQS